MKLSIVVLTCNQRQLTLRLLDSLAAYLSREPRVEVVVVDNGSRDATVEAIEAWRRDAGIEPERLRVLAMDVNKGVAAGRNAGIQASEGSTILLLDNDTIAGTDVIEACMAHLDAHPECGICAPALISPEGVVQASAKPFPGLRLKLVHALLHRELASEHREMLNPHPFYVIGAFQMFRRSTFDAAGPLDERIFYGPEDADFCMRVRSAGFTIDYLSHLRMIHDWQRATRRSPFGRLGRKHACGLLYFYLKHRRI